MLEAQQLPLSLFRASASMNAASFAAGRDLLAFPTAGWRNVRCVDSAKRCAAARRSETRASIDRDGRVFAAMVRGWHVYINAGDRLLLSKIEVKP